VSTAEGCAVVAKAVRDRLGGIDIIVHVVGGSSAAGRAASPCSTTRNGTRRWTRIFSRRSAWIARCCLLMLQQGSGRDHPHHLDPESVLPLPDATIAYAAAKAALSNYSKALSKEVSPKGVRVVRVSPGWVETDGAVGLVEEIARKNRTDYEAPRKIVMNSLGGHPARPSSKAEGSGGPRRVSRLAARRFHHRHRIRDRRRNVPTV